MTPCEARERLASLLRAQPEGPALVEAALLLAIDEYRNLDPAPYLDQIDDLAELVRVRNEGSEDPVYRLASLRRVLFEDAGFRGNREEYYDPRNSYLNEVLDRRVGIPITLGLLMLGVGGRLGWPLFGVNFPAHFLVACANGDHVIGVDPFHGGLILGEEELAERWESAINRPAPSVQEMLVGASAGAILARLLNNLKQVYVQIYQDFERAALVVEKMILAQPDQPAHHRDLGYLYTMLKQVEPAVQELQRYLRLCPEAADRDAILNCIQMVSESGLRWGE